MHGIHGNGNRQCELTGSVLVLQMDGYGVYQALAPEKGINP
jgi:hypothetical protein